MSWNLSRAKSVLRVSTQSVHQSTPDRLSLGAISGTGFFLILKAEAVLVCHAIISIVEVVTLRVPGLVCCMSLKRAQQPT